MAIRFDGDLSLLRRLSLRHRLLVAAVLAAVVALAAEGRRLAFEAARARTATVFSAAAFLHADGVEFRNDDGGRQIPLVLAAPGADVVGASRLVLAFDGQPGHRLVVRLRQFEGPRDDPAVLRLALDGEDAVEIPASPGSGLDPYAIEHGAANDYVATLPGRSRCGRNTLTIDVARGSWIAFDAVDVTLEAPRFLKGARTVAGAVAGIFGLAAWLAGPQPKRLSRPRMASLALGAASLVVGFGLAEGALRLAAPRLPAVSALLYRSADATEDGGNVLEDLRRHRCAPAPCSLDECGFRVDRNALHTPPYSIEKPAGVRRLVGIGDSFMNYGGPVPHRDEWFVRLRDRFAVDGIEAIDLGFSCIGLPTELRVLRGEALRLSPDLVIWSLYLGNDLSDEGEARVRRRGAPPPERPWSDRLRVTRLTAAVLRLARTDAAAFVPRCGAPAPPPSSEGCGRLEKEVAYDPRRKTLTDAWYESYARGRLAHLYRRDRRSVIEQDVADAMVSLEEGRQLLGSTPLLLVLIPDELQVSPREQGWALALSPEIPVAEHDFDFPLDSLRRALDAGGFDVVDVAPDFRAALDRGENPYQPNDGHLSLAGNRLLAARVAEVVAARLGSATPR